MELSGGKDLFAHNCRSRTRRGRLYSNDNATSPSWKTEAVVAEIGPKEAVIVADLSSDQFSIVRFCYCFLAFLVYETWKPNRPDLVSSRGLV